MSFTSSNWHGARRSLLAPCRTLPRFSPRKLLFQRTNVADQIFHLVRCQRFVCRHLWRLSLGDDFAELSVAHLLNVGGCHVGGLHGFLAFAVGTVTTGALGLERRFPSCRISFRWRA